MKRLRYFTAVVITVICAVFFSACSAKRDEATAYDMDYADMMSDDAGYAEDAEEASGAMSMNVAPQYTSSTHALASTISRPVADMEKIIRNISMNVETKEFDKLLEAIDSEITNLEGYVERSSITGRKYSSDDSLRRGNITARIPKDNVDLFIDTIYDNANVINKSEDTKNISLEYYDIESHKKALEIEQERLFELLGETDTVEEIITLESRLSSIRYELAQYETQLRTYDNKVDYATVTLELEEVERMSPAAEEKVTVWDRISTGFGDTMYKMGKGFQNFFVWFVVYLPYLLILGATTTAVVIILSRYILWNKRKKLQENTDSDNSKAK